MRYKLAIDFGTTNSVVACWDEATASGRTLDIPPLSVATSSKSFLIPTLLYVKDGKTGEIVLGQDVLRQGLDNQAGNRLFRNIKRTIGSESLLDTRIIDGIPWTDKKAGQAFLHTLLTSLPYSLEEIEQLVITVPVVAYDSYITWLNQSIDNLPAEKIRIVDEVTAAALGYAVTDPGAVVLVTDFGGGTFDLSLVRLPDGREKTGRVLFDSAKDQGGDKALVIAKAGVTLGGSDIDQWIAQKTLRRRNISFETLGAEYPRLLSRCEKAKIALSHRQETAIDFQIEGGDFFSETITRSELEILIAEKGFYTTLKQALEKVIGLAHQKGVYREDIRHVLMVGGTSLVPSVQQTIDEFFRSITQRKRKAITQMPTWPASSWDIENTSIRVDKPFTAVVEGALLVSTGFGLDDQLAHGYGLRFIDKNGQHHFDEIIPMGSTYPSKKPVSVILGTSHKKQDAIEFIIGQIDTNAATSLDVNYEDGQAVFVTQGKENASKIVPLNAGKPLIVNLIPPGNPGVKRLRAEFSVDAMRQLHLTITDLKTHKVLQAGVVVAKPQDEENEFGNDQDRSGNEPSLLGQKKAGFRLSLKELASKLNLLPPDKISIDVYAAALRSDDCMVRFNAADTLARRADRDARLIFEEVLQSDVPHQRASAARHLYRFSWFTAEPLYYQALADEDHRVHEAAIFSLCRMRLPEAYALVTDILENKNNTESMRMAAVWGLYSRPDPAAVPVLEVALRAENPETRKIGLEILGATETPLAIPVVKAALRDTHPEVQYAATLSWIELARETCFAELAEVIEQTRGPERHAILRGFFHATNYMGIEIGSTPDAIPLINALKLALNDDFPEVRLSAFMPLCWMQHSEAETALLEGFQHEINSQVKAKVLRAAADFMSPIAKKLQKEACQSRDLLLRQTAENLLEEKRR